MSHKISLELQKRILLSYSASRERPLVSLSINADNPLPQYITDIAIKVMLNPSLMSSINPVNKGAISPPSFAEELAIPTPVFLTSVW